MASLTLLLVATTGAQGLAQPAAAPVSPTGQTSTADEASSRIPDSVRTRGTITNDSDAAARVDNEPLNPALPGFFDIPGTQTRMRFSGSARLDVIHDLAPIGSPDDFIVSTIPVDVTSRNDNTRIHARQSRLDLELRRPSALGSMRILFESDFFGSSGERAFNLRHAYGQAANTLGGFTESTLADVDARPDTLDHEGPPARISARHAQLRYTFALRRRHSLSFGVENPKSDIESDVTVNTVTPRTPWPDGIIRYRRDGRRGHVQIGTVSRSIGGFVGSGSQEAQVLGLGAVASGSVITIGRDTMVFESAGGKGLARYVKDTSGLGLDAAIDETGHLRAVPIVTGIVGYQRAWTDKWRSTVTASMVNVETLGAQAPDTYESSRYWSTNLIYKSANALTMGVEVDYGYLAVKDGRHNEVIRVQFAVQYELVR